MRMTRQLVFGLWSAAAVVIAVGAFVVGGTLKEEEPPYYVFDLSATAYGGDLEEEAAMSPGGFTGFEDLIAGGSRTVLGGHIVELDEEDMVLETPQGARTTMRLSGSPAISRLESGGRELLQPGASVIVRLDETGQIATAVLVVSLP